MKIHVVADSNGNVNPKDCNSKRRTYHSSSKNFALIESLVANRTDKYAYSYTGANNVSAKYNLISEAVNGLISPDSLAVRIKDTDIKNASGESSLQAGAMLLMTTEHSM